jgi:hypothetical protein
MPGLRRPRAPGGAGRAAAGRGVARVVEAAAVRVGRAAPGLLERQAVAAPAPVLGLVDRGAHVGAAELELVDGNGPGAAAGAAGAAAMSQKRIVFVRHAESEWIVVFNRGVLWRAVVSFCRAVVREWLMLPTSDSVFIDSPLSRRRVFQAQSLQEQVCETAPLALSEHGEPGTDIVHHRYYNHHPTSQERSLRRYLCCGCRTPSSSRPTCDAPSTWRALHLRPSSTCPAIRSKYSRVSRKLATTSTRS